MNINQPTVVIEEVLGRTQHGTTEPFPVRLHLVDKGDKIDQPENLRKEWFCD